MRDSRKPSWMQLLAAVLFISIVAACNIKTTAAPTEIELATEANEAPISPSLPAETPPVPDAVLPTEDSRWVIAAEDGIYAVKPDGSDLKKLSDQIIYPIMMGPFVEGAPSGGHLAFSELSRVSDNLYLLSLSSGETKVVASLTSAIGQVTQGDPFFEATTYVVSWEGAAWSPDGRRLAFVGFIDDPTMDLYVYSVDDGSINRLTDGNTPTLLPIWSPDGKYISHHGVPGLLLGDGPDVTSLWVARADGSEDRKLFDGGEMAIGWMDSENLVIHSRDFWSFNLRTINVETGSEEVLWKDYFSDVAWDAEMGTLLLGVNQYAAEKNLDAQQGLYLIQVGGAPSWRIVEDEPEEVLWSDEADLFFVKIRGNGILAVSLTGDFIDLDVPASSNGFPLVAPGTRELAWTGSELWVSKLTSGLDNPPRQIFPEPVFQATWGPQGQHLLFISGGRLYVARSPEFSPVLVGEGLNADITAWVFP